MMLGQYNLSICSTQDQYLQPLKLDRYLFCLKSISNFDHSSSANKLFERLKGELRICPLQLHQSTDWKFRLHYFDKKDLKDFKQKADLQWGEVSEKRHQFTVVHFSPFDKGYYLNSDLQKFDQLLSILCTLRLLPFTDPVKTTVWLEKHPYYTWFLCQISQEGNQCATTKRS